MAHAKRIFCVIAYDISDDRRRNQVVKLLEKHGTRINFSVYECMFTSGGFRRIQQSILKKIDLAEDIVVYYPICVNCYTRIVYQSEKSQKINTVLMA